MCKLMLLQGKTNHPETQQKQSHILQMRMHLDNTSKYSSNLRSVIKFCVLSISLLFALTLLSNYNSDLSVNSAPEQDLNCLLGLHMCYAILKYSKSMLCNAISR
jgi:hypothetical protein